MVIGVVFDGKECVSASGCGCENQCDFVFEDMDSCKKACADIDPKCLPLDPTAYGLCFMIIGPAFDGEKCMEFGGCGCEPHCNHFFKTIDECEKACGL